ncbi:hypothetical protein K458DRAFT_471244 [Lentithecium fluviatile CBS 122367]|uniref:Uncharacterized protein n=1 Tax=Lentithecium fluviatile CBS 122367 TaxID=1168545 RepID=A0A6G1IC37_9PLEO|nr:hypothetical protein K458DRAFT_471244 [Lentithecium fluviatile CBS 122367]
MTSSTSQTIDAVKDVKEKEEVQSIPEGSKVAGHDREVNNAASDPFSDEFEITDNEDEAVEVAGRLSTALDAHLRSLITPIVNPSWLNNQLAYPNWPATSNLTDYFVGYHSNTVLSASSAIRFLENPLRTRHGLARIEDDDEASTAYYEASHSRWLDNEMEEQTYMARCIRRLMRHEELPDSETLFTCIGTFDPPTYGICSNVFSNHFGQHMQTRVGDQLPLGPSISSGTVFSFESCSFYSSHPTSSACASASSELLFEKVPVRDPDLRSYLPPARVVSEYDRLRATAREWDDDDHSQDSWGLVTLRHSHNFHLACPDTPHPNREVPPPLRSLRRISASSDLRHVAVDPIPTSEGISQIQRRGIDVERQQRSRITHFMEHLSQIFVSRTRARLNALGANTQATSRPTAGEPVGSQKSGNRVFRFLAKMFKS